GALETPLETGIEKASQFGRSAKLRDGTEVFESPTMESYKLLGFNSYPPGFAIMSRDEIQIFLQQQPGYVAPDDPGRQERHAWNLYIVTNDVKRALRGVLGVVGSHHISSALSAALRNDGVRRDGS